jgi:hypothetical protein
MEKMARCSFMERFVEQGKRRKKKQKSPARIQDNAP